MGSLKWVKKRIPYNGFPKVGLKKMGSLKWVKKRIPYNGLKKGFPIMGSLKWV